MSTHWLLQMHLYCFFFSPFFCIQCVSLKRKKSHITAAERSSQGWKSSKKKAHGSTVTASAWNPGSRQKTDEIWNIKQLNLTTLCQLNMDDLAGLVPLSCSFDLLQATSLSPSSRTADCSIQSQIQWSGFWTVTFVSRLQFAGLALNMWGNY